MIIMTGGVPCSGKITLMKKIASELGDTELVEPMKLFKCMRYKKGLVVGNYPKDELQGGTDRLAYGVISKFNRFITKQQKLHKHIIVEGDRFFIGKHLEWLFKKYRKNQVKVFILEASQEELDKKA